MYIKRRYGFYLSLPKDLRNLLRTKYLNQLDIVNLAFAYFRKIKKKDFKDRARWAAFNGYVDYLRTLGDIYWNFGSVYNDLIFYAVKGGHVNVMKWLEINSLLFCKIEIILKDTLMATGCWSGKLDILEYLKDKGFKVTGAQVGAARGHLNVLKWLLQNNCEKESYALTEARNNNHLECVRLLLQNGFEWSYIEDKTDHKI